MPDEALQTAFEIKTTCDEISRKLLRWHWENKPGEHSLGALLDHIRTRQQESPEYYDRLPDLAGRNSWQQLDTTLCMRVLLDPEKDAAHQLDLLGNTEHPAAARRACNAVRTARNEAAHASDRTAAAQAAILFNEAVEALEEGYAGAPLRTSELGQYYRLAEDYLSRCGAKAHCVGGPGRESPSRGKVRPEHCGQEKRGDFRRHFPPRHKAEHERPQFQQRNPEPEAGQRPEQPCPGQAEAETGQTHRSAGTAGDPGRGSADPRIYHELAVKE